ncbi:hypothetical protein F3Y22_tig00110945pilonHSYRG00336 [Hibiscus syriacus]|uniref:Uncharacterized protein n=1 Tax=Hibiscus syriacus TaxID=106335 RepID=A0A6A2ZAU6_HIBSY|nr:hypothetical protein F3Y22_tig00110945pilonHSYRG00336 [Hibiscus syriacus]
MSSLQRITLSNNHLQGTIPIEFCQLDLSVLVDLSVNNISGRIPSCFIRSRRELIEWKHYELDWWTFKLELSSVKQQQLPREHPNGGKNHTTGIWNRSLLQQTGRKIESVDLSYNKLSGNIPSQLVGLSFMSTFNVSLNNLSGRTPSRVAQFGTFDEFNYLGNPFLFGEPLPKCADTGSSPPKPNSTTNNDEDYGLIYMRAFRLTFITSYIMILLVVPVVLHINPYWRRAWFYHVMTAATFYYYFVLDNVLPRRFHCRNL